MKIWIDAKIIDCIENLTILVDNKNNKYFLKDELVKLFKIDNPEFIYKNYYKTIIDEKFTDVVSDTDLLSFWRHGKPSKKRTIIYNKFLGEKKC